MEEKISLPVIIHCHLHQLSERGHDRQGRSIIAGSTFRKPPEIVSVFKLRANGLLTNTKLARNVYNRGVNYKFSGLSFDHLNSHFK